MRPDTVLQHLGEDTHYCGAVTPPIFETSLFVHDTVASLRGMISDPTEEAEKFVYSRMGNPTLRIAEQKLAALEGTENGLLFGSGMAAISAAIMHCVRPGDHVVCVDTAYGPTRNFLTEYLTGWGVETTFVVGEDVGEFERASRPNTKLIYLESPSSVLFRFQDLRKICQFAQSRGIKTIADNSYATPLFQQPHSMGVDIVVHSATKYIAGHSDVVAGALCASNEVCQAITMGEGQYFGGRLAPFEAWLLQRGLRTLRLRVNHAEKQGKAVFEFLRARREVGRIFYAADPDSPHHGLCQSQMDGSTSLVTFMPVEQDEAKVTAFCEALSLYQIGVSWGGFESLVVPIFGKPMDWPEEKWVIRLYSGLEDINDLLADLDQAFVHLA